ncbi:MAG TPA: FAD-dependent thymidylate synthase [bacterium]|nr:FAD-dependent thymidylate synthase [bacterium]
MPELVRIAQDTFLSAAPKVTLVNAFEKPFDNAVATARTCYSSKGIVTTEQVAGEGLDEIKQAERRQRRDDLARSIYKAGHHTTLQHAHFQFALENVSRQFIWSFLHSHPFYNSEQVSQRYVTVHPDQMAVPPMSPEAEKVYRDCLTLQTKAYEELTEALKPLVEREYLARFKGGDPRSKKVLTAVQKKSQEVARYVLPVATFAYLYHTVSGLTLLRYWRLCQTFDAPLEQKLVVGKMVEEVLKVSPEYQAIMENPMDFDSTAEAQIFEGFRATAATQKAYRQEFDASLEGYTSKLVDYSHGGEKMLASAVREVFGVPSGQLSDDEAILLALDPSKNRYLGETLNVTTHSKLSRALFHPHYTFRKKITHTADSQDQRHRMTPASRPILHALTLDEPDYLVPILFEQDKALKARFAQVMDQSWEAIGKLRKMGVPDEFASYLLPNAVSVRFTESADLLNLHHKHAMRLCYNAQEEIWQASVDEAKQVREVQPRIGKWLLPPCSLRAFAGTLPKCPEGERFCGVVVWKKDLTEYQRVI